MHAIDIFVQSYFSLTRTPLLTEFFYLLTILFDFSLPFILVTLCVATLIYIVRGYRYTLLFLLTLISGGAIVYFLKIFFNVARPTGGVIQVLGQSFPSGHATIATIFFIMLVYIFDDYLDGLRKIAFNIFCLAFIFLVSFSRVYLGVHWLSDVIGGIILGFCISYLATSLFKRFMLK